MESVSTYLLTFLVNALWQIPLIGGVAMLTRFVMRHSPAAHRYAIFAVALGALLVLPAASVRKSQPLPEMRLAVPELAAQGTSAAAPAVSAAASPRQAPGRSGMVLPRTLAQAVLWLYVGFLAVRIGMFVRAAVRTVRIRRDAVSRAAGPAVERVFARCQRVLGVSRVSLVWSAAIPSPATAGIFRREIILPEALLTEVSDDVLATAIGHEMAHIARHDFATGLLCELLYLPVSFHPAAWPIHREIERTREMACDELATRTVVDAGAYARSIVNLAASMSGLGNPGYTLGVFDGDVLEERVTRLLEGRAAFSRSARLALAGGLVVLAVCAVAAVGVALPARAQGGAYNELKQGESFYNSGDFANAVVHFEHAVELEPSNVKAKLELANALMSAHFSGKTLAGAPLASRAQQQYLDVLASDEKNVQALEGMVTIGMQTQNPRMAREYALKLTALAPGDKTALYTLGVADWAVVYPELQRVKAKSGGRPEDYTIADPAARKALRDQYGATVDEGISVLQQALQVDPAYGDAMAYENLLFRLKASLTDDPAQASEFIATADQWVQKALAAKKLNGPSAPPGPASPRMMAAPPPPPPPPPPPATRRPASSAPVSGPKGPGMAGQFWQVAGNDGSMPAMDLFRAVRQKGFPAVLIAPDDQGVRVMVGPFFGDSGETDRIKGELEKAGFKALRVW